MQVQQKQQMHSCHNTTSYQALTAIKRSAHKNSHLQGITKNTLKHVLQDRKVGIWKGRQKEEFRGTRLSHALLGPSFHLPSRLRWTYTLPLLELLAYRVTLYADVLGASS